MTTKRCVDALQPTSLPYLDARPYVLFQQENASHHIAPRIMDFLQEAGVNVLPWPPHSPDLNSIKHVRDSTTHPLHV